MKKVVFITMILALCTVKSLAQDSGTCGENLTWTFESSTGTLTISGTGKMTDYNDVSNQPWYSFRSSITIVAIEDGVTSIEAGAFNGCTGLTTVAVKWTAPLSISFDVFTDIALADVRLIVPLGTKALYEAAPVWKDFRIEEQDTGNENIQPADAIRLTQSGSELHISHPSAVIDEIEIFDMNGRCVYRKSGFTAQSVSVASLANGVYVAVIRTKNSRYIHDKVFVYVYVAVIQTGNSTVVQKFVKRYEMNSR